MAETENKRLIAVWYRRSNNDVETRAYINLDRVDCIFLGKKSYNSSFTPISCRLQSGATEEFLVDFRTLDYIIRNYTKEIRNENL